MKTGKLTSAPTAPIVADKNAPHYVLTMVGKQGILSEYSSRRAAAKGALRAALRHDSEAFVLADSGDEWQIWDGYGPTGDVYDANLLARKTSKIERALENLE